MVSNGSDELHVDVKRDRFFPYTTATTGKSTDGSQDVPTNPHQELVDPANTTVTLSSPKVVFFDVDDTLVTDSNMSSDNWRPLTVGLFDGEEVVWVNEEAIALVKRFKNLGFTIVVWSQCGGDWAQYIVNKLDLGPYVSLCLSKPSLYVDDLECARWMGEWRKPKLQRT